MIRYLWEEGGDPDATTLHVSVRLPDANSGVSRMIFAGAAGPRDEQFGAALWAIEGLTFIVFAGYECRLRKGRVFDWPAIRAAVLAAFRERYGEMEVIREGTTLDGKEIPDARN